MLSLGAPTTLHPLTRTHANMLPSKPARINTSPACIQGITSPLPSFGCAHTRLEPVHYGTRRICARAGPLDWLASVFNGQQQATDEAAAKAEKKDEEATSKAVEPPSATEKESTRASVVPDGAVAEAEKAEAVRPSADKAPASSEKEGGAVRPQADELPATVENEGEGPAPVSKAAPSEGEQGPPMRTIDGSGEPFGAQAILLVGFSREEVTDFQTMLLKIGAITFTVIPATKTMLQGTLKEALEVEEAPEYEQLPLGTKRTIVLSGMWDWEVIEVVSAYQQSDQPPAVFAAAVPNNMGRQLSDLTDEVHREHAEMSQRAT